MPNLTKYQKNVLDSLYDIDNMNTRESLFAAIQENHPESKISKAMVADYVREKKKPKTTFVEQVSEDTIWLAGCKCKCNSLNTNERLFCGIQEETKNYIC